MRDWRQAEEAASRQSSTDDFYAAHGLCNDCGSHGARMIGWSKPANEIDIKAAEEFGIDELPLYETCPTCGGTGKAERSKWRGPVLVRH
jgi:ribosomal protein L32